MDRSANDNILRARSVDLLWIVILQLSIVILKAETLGGQAGYFDNQVELDRLPPVLVQSGPDFDAASTVWILLWQSTQGMA